MLDNTLKTQLKTYLERLVNRRRQMHGAGDRFEIIRAKGERIKVTVPADDIVRMSGHDGARETPAILREDGEISVPIMRENFAWAVKIALAIRRAHADLSFRMQVTRRDAHRVG